MTQNKLVFHASISVKTDTKRVKLELSPAELYGGETGLVRVRMGRRWLDGFYTAEGIGALVARVASGSVFSEPQPPDLPYGTWVKVHRPDDDDFLPHTTTVLNKTPIRLFDGAFYVLVNVPGYGFILVPAYDVEGVQRSEALYAKLHRTAKKEKSC